MIKRLGYATAALGVLLVVFWARQPLEVAPGNSPFDGIRLHTSQVLAQSSETPVPAPTEPSVSFHASRRDAKTGQPIEAYLSVGNVDPSLDLKVIVAIQAPPGLLLSGDSCASPGLCTGSFDLSSGQNDTIELRAIANQAGLYVLTADVTWRTGEVESTTTSTSLELNITDPAEGQTDVIIHADRTEVSLGDAVELTLTAANSIVKPPMTLKLILRTPSGWSLKGSGFAESCAGQCVATYTVDTGNQRNIDLELVPNQIGRANVEARLEWYFGDDESTLEKRGESLEINVVDRLAVTTETTDSGNSMITTASEILIYLGPALPIVLGFAIVIVVLPWFLASHVKKSRVARRIGGVRSLRVYPVKGGTRLTWDAPVSDDAEDVNGYQVEHWRSVPTHTDSFGKTHRELRLVESVEIAAFPTEYMDNDPSTGVTDMYTVTPFVAVGGPYGIEARTRTIQK